MVPPVEGTIYDVLNALPYFGRQPFAIASVNGDDVGINPFLDVVYRVSTHQGEKPVPVGVVSKNYRLVDHHQVLRALERTLSDCGLSPDAFQVRAQWTIYGERAHFSILFPPGPRFTMPVTSERDEMRFRIEIFNSVEGSYRLIAVAGWFRFVCLNGLILGTALFHLQRQHRQQLEIDELGKLIRDSIDAVEGDKSTFAVWLRQKIDRDVLVPWIPRLLIQVTKSSKLGAPESLRCPCVW